MGKYSSTQVALEGHPDRVCDIIADAILDSYIKENSEASVDIGVMLTRDKVILGGEISNKPGFPIDEVVRNTLKTIGYTNETFGLDAYKVDIEKHFKKQSQDITRGVNSTEQRGQGAGDIASVYGFAVNELPNCMPMALDIAWKITHRLKEVRISEIIEGVGLDGKVQVIVEYEEDRVKRLEAVIIAVQHLSGVDEEWFRMEIIENVVNLVCEDYIDENTKILVNTAGRFVLGGPLVELGMSGSKMEMYTYGGFSKFGGNTFSGKDPYKIDRTGSLIARKAARYLVEQGIVDKCEIMINYAIGLVEPVLIDINTFDTSNLEDSEILNILFEQFSFGTADIIEDLDLLKPMYRDLSENGHFGRNELSWEDVV
jgi:S-adenosylmethionine synthetase